MRQNIDTQGITIDDHEINISADDMQMTKKFLVINVQSMELVLAICDPFLVQRNMTKINPSTAGG